jgi:hypothetical protein
MGPGSQQKCVRSGYDGGQNKTGQRSGRPFSLDFYLRCAEFPNLDAIKMATVLGIVLVIFLVGMEVIALM